VIHELIPRITDEDLISGALLANDEVSRALNDYEDLMRAASAAAGGRNSSTGGAAAAAAAAGAAAGAGAGLAAAAGSSSGGAGGLCDPWRPLGPRLQRISFCYAWVLSPPACIILANSMYSLKGRQQVSQMWRMSGTLVGNQIASRLSALRNCVARVCLTWFHTPAAFLGCPAGPFTLLDEEEDEGPDMSLRTTRGAPAAATASAAAGTHLTGGGGGT